MKIDNLLAVERMTVTSQTPAMSPITSLPIRRKKFQIAWNWRSIVIVLVVILPLFGESTAYPALGDLPLLSRKTSESEHDLVLELLRRGQFEDAHWICDQAITGLATGQFQHALWTARKATVLGEQQSLGLYGQQATAGVQNVDQAIAQSLKPIDDLLDSYPDCSAQKFLRFHRLKIRQRLIQARVVASTVAPLNDELRAALVSRIAELRRDNQALQAEVESTLTTLREALDAKQANKISQRQRLVAELSIQRISLGLLQTELFDRSSRDYRSAAAVAETLAADAVQQLPDGTVAHQEATRMQAEAKLRSGDFRGTSDLVQQQRKRSGTLSPPWLAIEIRRLLASNRIDDARQLAIGFYGTGDVTDDSPASADVDDAWTRVLLATADTSAKGAVARWLDVIERRGGAFARRRAESIAIASLGSQATSTGRGPAGDPALIAAQGEDWLRRGDPDRGARLLLAAAIAETDSSKSLSIAAKSAAAFVSANNPDAAIACLETIAKRNQKDVRGAETMMQAALIASQRVQSAEDAGQSIIKLESLLRATYTTWPMSNEAEKANEWLSRIYTAAKRDRDAAYSSLQYAILSRSPDALDLALEKWVHWLTSLDLQTADEELESLGSALDELKGSEPPFSTSVQFATAWLMDRDRMPTTLPPPVRESDALANQIFVIRKAGSGEINATDWDPVWLERIRWRLFRDGFLDRSLQPSIGKTLLPTFGSDATASQSWPQAAAALWASPDKVSIDRISQLAMQNTDRKESQTDSLRTALKWLSSIDSREATQAAIQLSDRLATQLPIKTAPWYDAKIQSIRWLAAIGESDEAVKRAKYILLVQPPTDPEIRNGIEAIIEQTSKP